MKVAVFTSHIHWPTHYETELEIVQNHLDQGDAVTQLVCNAVLPTCDINLSHDLQTCLSCVGKRKFGAGLLSKEIPEVSIYQLTAKNKEEIKQIPKRFSSVEELQSFAVDNFDIGYAVASSLITVLRGSKPDLTDARNAVLLYDYLVSALAIYRSFQNYLDAHPIDRMYVFNGRFAHVKAALRACQSRKVDCYVHERGHSIHHYQLYHNTTPHNIAYFNSRMEQAWQEEPDEAKKVGIAERFYRDRARGVEQSWYSFVKDQEQGLLPEGWDPGKKNIVIFNSSEDEYASIGKDWENHLYTNQLEALQRIRNAPDLPSSGYHIYLRVHPNLRNASREEKDRVNALEAENFTVIPSESAVSTYTMLLNAEKVLSFGSSVGIEATYWGRPSILAAKCFYMGLGGTYNPATHEELMRLLTADLVPKDKLAALKYGYYLSTFGIPFVHYQAETIASGKFKQHYLAPARRYGRYINILYQSPKWQKHQKEINRYLRKAVRKWKLGL